MGGRRLIGASIVDIAGVGVARRDAVTVVDAGLGVTSTTLLSIFAGSTSALVAREKAVGVLMATTHMGTCGDELAIGSDTHSTLWRVAREGRVGGHEPVGHQTQGQAVRTLQHP